MSKMTSFGVIYCLIIVFVVFASSYMYLLIEEGRELQVWEQAPNTLHLYNTSLVCVASQVVQDDQDQENEDSQQFDDQQQQQQRRSFMMISTQTVDTTTTASTPTEVDHDHHHILNCGHCGSCSNVHDIMIYQQTRNNLTSITTECTKQGFYRGKNLDYVKKCLQQKSQLTTPCIDCWIQNVQCNWKHCFKTCIKHKAPPFKWLPSLYHRQHTSPLDPCIECDERMCGPNFVQCAGANRRRVGVVSDLQRNMQLEICNQVDWNWIATMEKEQNHQEPSTTTSLAKNAEEVRQESSSNNPARLMKDDEVTTSTETDSEL